jgi:hypothetical protein
MRGRFLVSDMIRVKGSERSAYVMRIHAYRHLSSGIAILLLLQMTGLVNITIQVQESLSPWTFNAGHEKTTGMQIWHLLQMKRLISPALSFT